MKKILFLVLVCFLANACCSKNKITNLFSPNSHKSALPKWVFNPYIENGVAAVGVGYPNQINKEDEAQKLAAENEARAEIYKIINAKFSRITSEILQQIDFKKPAKVKKIFDKATKEVIKNVPISKAYEVNKYRDKEGILYIRLLLKNQDYQKSPKSVQQIYQNHVDESDLKGEDLEKANEAVKALFGLSKNHYWVHKTDFY